MRTIPKIIVPVILLIVISVGFYACHEHKPNVPKYPHLVGDWFEVEQVILAYDSSGNLIEDIPPPPPPGVWHKRGFTFLSDSTVDTKLGYYKIVDADSYENRKRIFLGTVTRYKIEEDSLKIYSLKDSTWWSRKIYNLSADSLFLTSGNNLIEKYARVKINLDTVPNFDKIVLSSSGCYGTCPIVNIIIKANGEVIYFGERYTTKNGYFTATINKEQYQRLADNFRKADIANLLSRYTAGHTDDEKITTTFLVKGRIYKSISDYGNKGPAPLIWGYIPLRNLYQSLDLKPISTENLPYYLELHYFRFEKGKKILNLTQAESFLLWDYLRQGKKINRNVNKKFNLHYNRNYTWFPPDNMIEDVYDEKREKKVIEIETDGQLYTFAIDGKETVTIDIGFNFIDTNFKMSDFREEGEYD